jgi:hypothetical protein
VLCDSLPRRITTSATAKWRRGRGLSAGNSRGFACGMPGAGGRKVSWLAVDKRHGGVVRPGETPLLQPARGCAAPPSPCGSMAGKWLGKRRSHPQKSFIFLRFVFSFFFLARSDTSGAWTPARHESIIREDGDLSRPPADCCLSSLSPAAGREKDY